MHPVNPRSAARRRRIAGLLAILPALALPSLAVTGASAAPAACGDVAVSGGGSPSGVPGYVEVVDSVVNPDCSVSTGRPHLVPRDSLAGSAPTSSRQATVHQLLLDEDGLPLNEFETSVTWEYWTGGPITRLDPQEATSYAVESVHGVRTGGWSLAYTPTLQLAVDGGGVGTDHATYEGHVGMNYQGVLDRTGRIFHNEYYNAVTVDSRGGRSCRWWHTWRRGLVGWHIRQWCDAGGI